MAIRAIQTATGGAGGPTLVVDTLALSGPTSLPYCLKTVSGPRIITFAPELSGVIELPATLKCEAGDGDFTLEWSPRVALKGSAFTLSGTKNFIIRGLISLPGDGLIGQSRGNRNALDIVGDAANGLVEGSLCLWAIDENVSFYPRDDKAPHNIEFRYNVVAEPLRNAGHPKGKHGYNLLVGSGCKDIGIHHNLIMTGIRRHPAIKHCINIQVFNNVIAGWEGAGTRMFGLETVPIDRHAIIVSNVYHRLGMMGGTKSPIALEHVPTMPQMELEIAGNKWADGTSCGLAYGDCADRGLVTVSGLKSPLCARRQTAADEIKRTVLGKAGPVGDFHRERIVAQFRSGVGRIIDSQDEVGGYGTYEAAARA